MFVDKEFQISNLQRWSNEVQSEMRFYVNNCRKKNGVPFWLGMEL
jgi:hypothetical protein